jgi:hypothetical protein
MDAISAAVVGKLNTALKTKALNIATALAGDRPVHDRVWKIGEQNNIIQYYGAKIKKFFWGGAEKTVDNPARIWQNGHVEIGIGPVWTQEPNYKAPSGWPKARRA